MARPLAHVHLVDGHHQLTHAQRLDEERVLARLPALLEARLELALDAVDDQNGAVGLARARDHVRNEVLVAWGPKKQIRLNAD